MLSQLPAAVDGGQRRELGLQELCFKLQYKSLLKPTDDIYWDMEIHFPHNFSLPIIYRSLNTSAWIAGKYLLLSDYRKYSMHMCERSRNKNFQLPIHRGFLD